MSIEADAIRRARQFIWVAAEDCIPPHGLDMDWPHDADKVKMLCEAFLAAGFDRNMPALVGYPLNGKIQLLSGTHRHRAASMTGTKLPVTIWLRDNVERSWGTELWPELIADIPVKELESFEVEDGPWIPPYDKVQF